MGSWALGRVEGAWGRGSGPASALGGPDGFAWYTDLRREITQLAGGNFKPVVVLTGCP